MQITLKPEVQAAIVRMAEVENRTPTNYVNKVLADHIAAKAQADEAQRQQALATKKR
jgi:hypothetical protein